MDGSRRDGYHRSAYTILELMISLVLLATLSMVAWSILETYRTAEQRAWNQTYQMQVIRIAREWLETDAACLMEPRIRSSSSAVPPTSFSSSSFEWKPFKGDEQGFEVDLIPSTDPLAWLQELTRAAEPLTTTTQAFTPANQNTAIAIDPVAVHRLSYQIVAGATSPRTNDALFDVQRELAPIDRWSKASPSSEKLLTTEDLYRVSDDELPTDSASVARNRSTRIRKLITPRFRYSDGKEWTGQWDSVLKGGLPRAIELSFDLPAASTDYETVEPEPDETEEFMAEDFANDAMSSENLVTVDASTTAVDDGDALARDVRIVVLVGGSASQGVQDEWESKMSGSLR